MVLRLIGIKEETNYAEEITSAAEPDFHKRVSKSSPKLGDEPMVIPSGSRMNHKVRNGVIKPTLEVEGQVDLKTIGHTLKGLLDNYIFTSGATTNTHEFYGGECSDLTSFSCWATMDKFEKLIKGLMIDSLKLDVSNELMTGTESYIYSNEKWQDIDENTYEVREAEGAIPVMFYDVSVELGDAPWPGVATSLSFECNNNLNVDGTIGLGSRAPQRKASAQKRKIKISVVAYMTRETIDFIRKSEYGEDVYEPSECKIFTTDFKINISYCEDSSQSLELYFPRVYLKAEYESQEADEIETTFNMETLGSGEVELLDGTTVHTDIYCKLINDVGEISPMMEEEEEDTYSLTFSVTDGTDPISGATITIGETTKTTGSAGGCTFSGLEAGTVNYSVSKDGYTTVTDSTTIIEDDTVTVTMAEESGE